MSKEQEIFEYLSAQVTVHHVGRSLVLAACKRFIRESGKLGIVREARQPIPREWVESAFKRQRGLCADCEVEMQIFRHDQPNYATGDHVVPLGKGGQHKRSNIRAVCKSCNSRKGDKDAIEYSKHTGRLMTNLTKGAEDE